MSMRLRECLFHLWQGELLAGVGEGPYTNHAWVRVHDIGTCVYTSKSSPCHSVGEGPSS